MIIPWCLICREGNSKISPLFVSFTTAEPLPTLNSIKSLFLSCFPIPIIWTHPSSFLKYFCLSRRSNKISFFFSRIKFFWRWLFVIMGWIILLRPEKIRVNLDCGGDFIGIFQDGFNVEVYEVFGLFGERACEFFVTYGMCGNLCYLADLWLSFSI